MAEGRVDRGGSLSADFVGTTAPGPNADGLLWFNPTTQRLLVSSRGQWVDLQNIATQIVAKNYVAGTVAAAVNPIITFVSPNDGQKHMYRISVTITPTTLGSGSISGQISYTADDGSTQAASDIPLTPNGGGYGAVMSTAFPYKGTVQVLVNPGVTVSVFTAGTFTGCTYNCSATAEFLY